VTQAVSEILEPYVREVPPRFTDWTRRVYGRMGLRLTKAQHATARVAFDGADPETQLERDIFGGITHVPAGARRMIVLRFGRDSGKTQLCSMFGLHRMLVGDLSRCGPGDDPAVAIVSPRKKQSRIALKRALAIVRGMPELERMLVKATTEEFILRRDGRDVYFTTTAKSGGGAAGRGFSFLLFLVDEAEFVDTSKPDSVIKTEEILSSARPRLLPGAPEIMCSTPWPVKSFTADLFDKNFGNPTTALAAMATSLLMRDGDPEIAAKRDLELAIDPTNALREYDCVLTDATGAFFPSSLVDAAVARGKELGTGAKRAMASSGVDLGFEADSSAHVIVERHGGRVVVVHVDMDSPEPGKPLVTSVICRKYVDDAREGGCTELTADKHYVLNLREAAAPYEMQVLQGHPSLGRQQKTDAFMYGRELLRESALVLPNNPMLISQLKSVIAVPQRGGAMTFVLPRRAGMGHADLVPALLNALWHDRRHGAFRAGASPVQAPQAIRGGWEF
jgi:hypothetical protein